MLKKITRDEIGVISQSGESESRQVITCLKIAEIVLRGIPVSGGVTVEKQNEKSIISRSIIAPRSQRIPQKEPDLLPEFCFLLKAARSPGLDSKGETFRFLRILEIFRDPSL